MGVEEMAVLDKAQGRGSRRSEPVEFSATMTQRYQERIACPYCGKKVKPLQRLAHIRLECHKAPEEVRRSRVEVSVKGKWRPRNQ